MEEKKQMSPSVVYLAAAVDLSKSSFDPFKMMAQRLKPATCFMPRDAFNNASGNLVGSDAFVVKLNSKAIRESDVVVVYYDPVSFSFGVPMEILYASYFDKPIIMVTKDGKLPNSIYARTFVSVAIKEEELCYEKLKAAYSLIGIMRAKGWGAACANRNQIIKDIFNKGE